MKGISNVKYKPLEWQCCGVPDVACIVHRILYPREDNAFSERDRAIDL